MTQKKQMQKKWLEISQYAQGVVLPALLAINVLVAANQYSLFEKNGEHSAKIDQLLNSVQESRTEAKSQFKEMIDKSTSENIKTKSELDKLRQNVAIYEAAVNASQADVAKMLISTNVVKPDDIFQAFLEGDQVWIVPSSALRLRLDTEGFKIERVSEKVEIYGYKMMKLSTVKPKQ